MLGASQTINPATLAQSIQSWWALAGVDCAVSDTPMNWLERQRVPTAEAARPAPVIDIPRVAPEPVPVAPVVEEPVVLPGDLPTFLDWLATSAAVADAPEPAQRILPRIVADCDLMVVTDMPDEEDMGAGTLFAGRAGKLIDAMLRAVAIAPTSLSCASLLMDRPAGGVASVAAWRGAADRMTHLIGLARPKQLLLMGDGTSRALSRIDGQNAFEFLPFVNHGSGTVPAMHIPSPSILMRHGARKAAAWAELRMIKKY